MKRFTGKLVIKFTAKVQSREDLQLRCERIAARAGESIGCERWEVADWVEMPNVIPLGHYAVQLCTVGNPDWGQYAPVTDAEWKIVATMSEAKAAVGDYLERNDGISGGNWAPESGQVWDHQGKLVARFTYSLRCWSLDGDREIMVG